MAKKHLCSKKIISLTFLFTILLCVFLVSFLLIKPVFAQSTVIYVDCNATAGGDGSSWGSAFTTIQEGINAADAENLDVWVAMGTYYERITLRDGVKCYGGFAGTETELDQRDYENNQTVIDGQQGGSVVTGANNSRIDGFTITNGYAQTGGGIYCKDVQEVYIVNNNITSNEAYSYSGGGIYHNNYCAFIYNNTITHNKASGSGGGIRINLGGGHMVEDNTISHNSSYYGAGIYANTWCYFRRNIISNNISAHSGGGIFTNVASSTIEENTIKNNCATSEGGGIYCNAATIINWNEITGNRTWYDGGGIFCYAGTSEITNNYIAGNISDARGGGIACRRTSSASIRNCFIASNRANAGGGIATDTSGNLEILNCTIVDNHASIHSGGIACWVHDTIIKNCIFWGNSGDFGLYGTTTYSNIEDGDAGVGNISADPMFTDPDNGDYHLNPNSPCVDAGDPAPYYFDPDWSRNDMGVYGGPNWGVADGEIPAAPPGIVYVNIKASPGGDGRSWETACQSIQSGLDIADDYNEDVLVAQGTYLERITLKSGVCLYGGFAGTETSIDQRDYKNNTTVIDGQQGGSVVTTANNSRIDGFTIQNGKAQNGGGIYCSGQGDVWIEVRNSTITSNTANENGGGIYNTNFRIFIYNNIITLNMAQNYGGGIYSDSDYSRLTSNNINHNEAVSHGGGAYISNISPGIEDNIFHWNESGGNGGGIYNDAQSNIRRNIITENKSVGKGGGIYEDSGNSNIEHNTIKDNYAIGYGGGLTCHTSTGSRICWNEIIANRSWSYGGGICCSGGAPEIGENHIISNISDSIGGGICCLYAASPTIRNNLILNNQAVSCGAIQTNDGSPTIINNTIVGNTGGICSESSPSILNCILWANGDDLSLVDPNDASFSNIEDGDEGEGNINEDPLFVDSSNGDYHLDTNSPCIDTGHPMPQYNDQDWTRNDMGCYGWSDPLPDTLSVISVTPSTVVDFGEVKDYADHTFTVKNTGPGIMSGTASTSSPFSIISGGSYSLGHGESQDVVVRFSPTETVFYSKTVSFTGGGGAERSVTGTGLEETPSCTADVDEDCDLDVFDLVFMNRHLQGFPIIVPSLWHQMDPNIPLDTEISSTIEECKTDYNIDTRNEFDVFDLVIINRYIQDFSTIVPSAWRDNYPEIPPDSEIALAAEALKPVCPLSKARKRDLIRYYNGSESTGQLGINNLSASGGEAVRIPVYLDTNDNLFSITFDIHFDPNKLEATALEKNDTRVKVSLGSDAIDNTTGRIIVNILDMTGQEAVTKGQGKILDILFNVKVTPTTTENTPLILENLRSVYAVTGQSPDIQLQNGILTIDDIPNEYCCRDADNDTYGDDSDSTLAVTCPQGYVQDNTDCDDTDPNSHPGAPEICDGKDNNCNGTEDEPGAKYCTTYYKDQDNDTYGVTSDTLCLCNPQGIYTATRGGDTDDIDPNIPGETPCQFIAAIAAQGQNIPGAESISTVIIGIDHNYYTYPAPPNPPPGYTVYMTIAEQYSEDVRQPGSETQQWELNIMVGDKADPNTTDFFPIITWDPDALCHTDPELGYSFKLYPKGGQGTRKPLVSDMIQTSQYQTKEEDGQCVGKNCFFSYIIEWSKHISVEMNFLEGWSMISLPVIPDDAKVQTLFPGAVVAYGYEKGAGYVRVLDSQELQVGHGYWILFNTAQTHVITGQPIPSYTRTFNEDGWYMVGGCTSPSQPSADSCNIVVMYKYEKGFGYKRVPEAEDLEPGRGFWILFEEVAEQCQLTVEDIEHLSMLRARSGSTLFRSVPQDNIWALDIKALGQGGDSSTVIIGIDPNGQAYPYPPSPPPGFTVVIKIKGGSNGFGGDLRAPGPEQKVWELSVMAGGETFGGNVDAEQPGFFPILSWNPDEIGPAEVMDLRLGDANGPVLLDMRTTNTYQTLQTDADEYLPLADYASFSYAVVLVEIPPAYCRDADGDGYGDSSDKIQYEDQQDQPQGYVLNCGDCNDSDSTWYPGAPELCDGRDNDCDGVIPSAETTDADGDGFVACNECNDNDPNTYPGAPELCDGKDNDCDQTIPQDELDIDRDGFFICEGDCDDTDSAIYLNAPEFCDGKDNDCNGIIDDPNAIVYTTYYRDADGDGLGDPNNSLYECKQPEGYVLNSIDHNDTDFDNTYYPSWNYPPLWDFPSFQNQPLQIPTWEDPFNGEEDADADYEEMPDEQVVYYRATGFDDIDNISQNWPDDHCYLITNLIVNWESNNIFDQTANVGLGVLESGLGEVIINPDNWSEDYIVRLQLIDAQAGDIDITDPNTFAEEHYLVEDVRESWGQTEINWYILVEISEATDPNASDYYPVLSWDANDFGCEDVNGNGYDYQLLRGLGSSGIVLVDNMADTNSCQTSSQDGGLIKYFTILGTQTPEDKEDVGDEVPPQKTYKQILPWPGAFPGAPGWSGFSLTGGFPVGLPSTARSGYPPGLSIPGFPGTYTGFAYPGGMNRAWTSFVPRFPSTFPVLGIFSPIGQGWHGNYRTGYPLPSVYQTGWFHTY